MNLRATLNYDDGWIRVEILERLSKEDFRKLAADTGLKWKRGEQVLAGPYSPYIEDVLFSRYGVLELEEEQVDLIGLAEDRADKYQEWSDNAATRAETARKKSDDAVAGIPMGQPILVGHHSEKRHRRDLEKSRNAMHRYLEESDKSDKWADRAARTVAAVRRKYTPLALHNRINTLNADKRKYERQQADYAEGVKANPLDRAAASWEAAARRMIVFLDRRLEVAHALLEQAELDAAGDISQSVEARLALPIEVSGGISDYEAGCDMENRGWLEVVRINKKTVTVCWWLGVKSLEYKFPKEKIRQAMSAADWAQTTKYPYGGALRIERVREAA